MTFEDQPDQQPTTHQRILVNSFIYYDIMTKSSNTGFTTATIQLCVCVRACVRACVCVCVCERERERERE